MNYKVLATALLAASITGCSTTDKETGVVTVDSPLEATPVIKTSEAKFVEQNGTITIEFTETGEFVSLKSSGTSPLNFNNANAIEEAMMVATMRAKRNVAEFLSNDIRSVKVSKNISDVVMNDTVIATNDEESSEKRNRANTVAFKVTETIKDRSDVLLHGLMVVNRNVDNDTNQVSVDVEVSVQSISASKKVRMLMGGL